jgi:hypothetical protein
VNITKITYSYRRLLTPVQFENMQAGVTVEAELAPGDDRDTAFAALALWARQSVNTELRLAIEQRQGMLQQAYEDEEERW